MNEKISADRHRVTVRSFDNAPISFSEKLLELKRFERVMKSPRRDKIDDGKMKMGKLEMMR